MHGDRAIHYFSHLLMHLIGCQGLGIVDGFNAPTRLGMLEQVSGGLLITCVQEPVDNLLATTGSTLKGVEPASVLISNLRTRPIEGIGWRSPILSEFLCVPNAHISTAGDMLTSGMIRGVTPSCIAFPIGVVITVDDDSLLA